MPLATVALPQHRNVVARVVALTLLAVGLLAAPAVAAPYAVGSRSVTWVDTSRPTAPNRTFPGAPSRTLKTLLLFPTAGPAGRPVRPGATPLARRGGFPLIVFSHGFTANGPAYQFLLERFVRAGYVVAAPTFPLSNNAAPGGPNGGDYANQPADVSFVIDRVRRLARNDARLRRTVGARVGVLGHSLGGITTLGVAANSCCLDPRIDAAIAFSGIALPFQGGSFFPRDAPPLMLLHGTKDTIVPYAGSVNAYAGTQGPKAFLTLEGAGHVPFAPPHLEPSVRAMVDFFDGYLKQDRAALVRMPADATVPGVSSLQRRLRPGGAR